MLRRYQKLGHGRFLSHLFQHILALDNVCCDLLRQLLDTERSISLLIEERPWIGGTLIKKNFREKCSGATERNYVLDEIICRKAFITCSYHQEVLGSSNHG